VARESPLVRRAWELCYLDPLAARDLGRDLAQSGGPEAAAGWLHVAMAEVRVGDEATALAALPQARAAFAERADALGLALCDEVQAIYLRRVGDYAGSAALQADIDRRDDFERDAMYRFVAHNSRAITHKVLGHQDEALRHFYAAHEAAQQTDLQGPLITALSNLAGYHQNLFNHEDGRAMGEQALRMAREVGARQIVGNSAINLITAYHALGEPTQARAMAEFILTHPEELLPGSLQRYALPLALGHLAVGEIDAALQHLKAGAIAGVSDGDGMSFWAWLKARCLLAQGQPAQARAVAEQTLLERRQQDLHDHPYDAMQLHRALADACEAAGDAPAALAYLRQGQAIYEQLVGRSARARYMALEVSHRLALTQRERDVAIVSRRTAEQDRQELAELNAALQAQIAETEMLHAKLREQALRDPLTGLHNRRYLFEMAPALLELARRQGNTLSVVLLDLDHFKLLNDTYGHQAGDLVLQRFAALLTQMLRRSDIVCRHGGEEFVAVMPDIDAEGTESMLNRLLLAFQAHTTESGRRRLPGGSFSAGIAMFPRHGTTLEQLLSRADRGLYAAKNHGRARIEVAPRTGFGTLT
jgi:diguanylate cyclase (GGDEF)-like protein